MYRESMICSNLIVYKPSMFYTTLYIFIGMIVHLIVLLRSNEKVHLNWMLTREISVFCILAAENNWNKCVEIHDSHLTSGNINLKFKSVVVCSDAVWSYLNTIPSIRDKEREKPHATFPEKLKIFYMQLHHCNTVLLST